MRHLLSMPILAWLLAAAALADEPPLRQVASKHLTLHTDLAADEQVDALPAYFDQAFDAWCAAFGVDAAARADWHVQGCLMHAREPFRAAGLLPAELPEFATGYSRPSELWLFDQTSDYYRRHLLLHEGTHCFMHALAGGVGPPWYAEGMAELLATHRLENGRVVLGVFPKARDEVSKWGRIEAVQTAYAAGRAKSLADIFDFRGTLHGDVESYSWCWAAAALLDGHPRYRTRFRSLRRHVRDADFARRLDELFAPDRATLDEDWQLFVAQLDYGYDFERTEIDRMPGVPLRAGGQRVQVAADRGWQSSGIALVPGKYRLRAGGRYQVRAGEPPWISEPGGVTIEYDRGRPLGLLLAAIRSDDATAGGPSGLLEPQVVGLEATLVVERPGTLYFRINDSAGGLADNRGSATVEIASK